MVTEEPTRDLKRVASFVESQATSRETALISEEETTVVIATDVVAQGQLLPEEAEVIDTAEMKEDVHLPLEAEKETTAEAKETMPERTERPDLQCLRDDDYEYLSA